VNDSGLIVGRWYEHSSGGANTQLYAFLFDTNTGDFIDLNTLIDPASGWQMDEAVVINNQGQIIGWGTHDGATGYFELVVPEPQLGDGLLRLTLLTRIRKSEAGEAMKVQHQADEEAACR
jgi:hypothetical protein